MSGGDLLEPDLREPVTMSSGQEARVPSRMMARAARWLEPDMDPPGQPATVVRVATMIALALLAIPLSAIPRQLGAPSMNISLAITAVILAGSAALLWPLLGARRAPLAMWLPVTMAGAAMAMLAIHVLAAPAFDGLPALTGGDAGLHVGRERAFVTIRNNGYEGMATFYATAHWFQIAGDDWIASFRDSFWVVVAMVAILPVAVAGWASAQVERTSVRLAVGGLGIGAAAGAAWLTALPFLHYYQCDGYFPQLFGVVPIIVTAIGYTAASTRLLRLVVLGAGIVFLRFTYLLNLGEMLIVTAAMLAIEAGAVGLPRAPRLLLGGGALATFGLAGVVYWRLWQVVHIEAGIHSMPLPPVAIGLGLSAMALLGAAAACPSAGRRRRAAHAGGRAARAFRRRDLPGHRGGARPVDAVRSAADLLSAEARLVGAPRRHRRLAARVCRRRAGALARADLAHRPGNGRPRRGGGERDARGEHLRVDLLAELSRARERTSALEHISAPTPTPAVVASARGHASRAATIVSPAFSPPAGPSRRS